MLHDLIAGSSMGNAILEWVEIGALAIEMLAVATILFAILYSFGRYVVQVAHGPGTGRGYEQLKISLGRALLLGLEILVAAGIVRTVALEATLESIAVLGLLVLIRTFLSWRWWSRSRGTGRGRAGPSGKRVRIVGVRCWARYGPPCHELRNTGAQC